MVRLVRVPSRDGITSAVGTGQAAWARREALGLADTGQGLVSGSGSTALMFGGLEQGQVWGTAERGIWSRDM